MSGKESTVLIRPFRPADQAACEKLILGGLSEHFEEMDRELNPDLRDIQDYFIQAGHSFFVAVQGREIIGTAGLIEESPGEGRIVRMSVSINRRREGIGRALLKHILAEAKRSGFQRVIVETNQDWDAAINLYKASGFTVASSDQESTYFLLTLK